MTRAQFVRPETGALAHRWSCDNDTTGPKHQAPSGPAAASLLPECVKHLLDHLRVSHARAN
eukprot:2267133-Lingulodinium_polyedra.AAC.1